MKQIFTPFIYFFSLALLLGSCEDSNTYPIPNNTVDIVIFLDGYDNTFAIGQVKTFNSGRGYAGYLGVVVYRSGPDEFLAYDMACPNDHYNGCKIIEHSSDATAPPSDLCLQCSKCCKAKFSLLDGYPQGSTYKYPLKSYKVTKINDYRFRIHN